MKRCVVTFLLVTAGLSTAVAHPGSGIVVTPRGSVYFVDTGAGVWSVTPGGKLVPNGGPRFHWMAMEQSARPLGARLPAVQGGEIVAVGANPRLLVSSDVPIAVGSDGALYYPEFRSGQGLRVMRFARSGAESVWATLPGSARWINGLAARSDGSLYYTQNQAVRRIAPDGSVSSIAEGIAVPDCARIPGAEGPYLRGLAVAADGTVFVAASGCGAVLKITPRGEISTVLRTTSPWSPTAAAISPSGLYVLEYLHTVEEDRRAWVPRVRKLLSNGKIVPIAAVVRR